MIFRGSATALITPFTENGIDFEAYGKLIENQIQNGTNALVILGTTGEPATMTWEERAQTIKFAINKIAGRVPAIVGAGSNATSIAIKNAIEAQEFGADAILVVTPYYNKATQNGLIAHYNAIAKATTLPVIAYNVPGRTGVNLLPQTFATIVENNSNVVAIKEACGNMEQIEEVLRLVEGKADVYSGDDGLTLPILAMGGQGVISVASNIFPKQVAKMCNDFFDGNLKDARKLQLNMLPLIKALFSEVNPIPVKYASKYVGLSNGIVRLPLTEMTDTNAKNLEFQLNEFIKNN